MPLQGRAYRANRSTINLHRWLATVFVNLVLGVASIFSVVSPLVAAPVTYTEEATASGSLGGVAFTNADVVLSMTNDTDNVIRNGAIFSNVGIATVTVASNAPITFAHSIEVFSDTTSPIAIAGFRDGGIIILDNAGIAPGYDLRTSTGPTSGTFSLGHSGPFATTIGDFILTRSLCNFPRGRISLATLGHSPVHVAVRGDVTRSSRFHSCRVENQRISGVAIS